MVFAGAHAAIARVIATGDRAAGNIAAALNNIFVDGFMGVSPKVSQLVREFTITAIVDVVPQCVRSQTISRYQTRAN